MLNLLDSSLERFLRAGVPLPARDIDVAFEAPDSDWAGRVSKPTINLYLWDIRPSMGERDLGMVDVKGADGRRMRRGPMPRIECRYLITAWTTEVDDEHSLLGRVLVALSSHPVIGVDHLDAVLARAEPLPTIELRTGSSSENSDFWSALGGQLKPGLDVAVTITLDTDVLSEVGPPVSELQLGQLLRDPSLPDPIRVDDPHPIVRREDAPTS